MSAMVDAIGHGTQFQWSDDQTSGGIFAALGKIFDISAPGLSRDVIDVTNMASTERWREFISGLKDAGEVSFDIVFDPDHADITQLETEFDRATAGYYKLVFPDSDEWGFSGLITGIEPNVPVGDHMRATVTVKLTGKPGWFA